MIRVIFDTNTVISALLFRGEMSWLVEHWRGDETCLLASRATASELLRVLHYPKFKLDSKQVETLAARYLPYAERVDIAGTSCDFPQCRDPKDQIFIELGFCGQTDVLVSGDGDLLAMKQDVPFAIETPAEYARRIRRL
ncbi:MAG: putative toxin-antitoxin system toxin component, PIN family [Candidatus Methylumidiphilus sp.]